MIEKPRPRIKKAGPKVPLSEELVLRPRNFFLSANPKATIKKLRPRLMKLKT
jgi:hypothetical protein